MNKIQKIFLPKYKYNILESIEQNADKINYNSCLGALTFDYKYIIETPQMCLCAKSESPVHTKSFDFAQYAPAGYVTCLKSEYSTKFAERVYLKMFNAYKKLQNQNPSKDK